jgi:HEAT repeat protein
MAPRAFRRHPSRREAHPFPEGFRSDDAVHLLQANRSMSDNPFADGWTMEDMEAAIQRNVPEELLYVPPFISLDPPDCAWATDVCLRLATHPHSDVRGNAVLGLGHLARTCGSLSEDRVAPVLRAALQDEHPDVRAHAHDAISDVEKFLGWRLGIPNPLRDWFDGLEVEGAAFRLDDAVEIVEGPHAGASGTVVWWFDEKDEFTVELGGGAGDVDLPPSALRPAS